MPERTGSGTFPRSRWKPSIQPEPVMRSLEASPISWRRGCEEFDAIARANLYAALSTLSAGYTEIVRHHGAISDRVGSTASADELLRSGANQDETGSVTGEHQHDVGRCASRRGAKLMPDQTLPIRQLPSVAPWPSAYEIAGPATPDAITLKLSAIIQMNPPRIPIQ